MADESDVSNALAALVAAVIRPSGTSGATVTGIATKVYRGFPQASSLDADLIAQKVNVTIQPRDGMSRNTTRWQPLDIETPAVEATITASVAGATVTFGGTITPGDLVGIAVERTGYAYLVKTDDTLASVAGYYAVLFSVASSGPSVTIPTNYDVSAATLAKGSSVRITRQTEQGFTITVWAFDYPSRDATASAIDGALSALSFINLADGSVGRLRFQQTFSRDRAENANLYQRDLVYHVDYPATMTTIGARALFVGSGITRIIGSEASLSPDAVTGEVYSATPNL